MNILKFERKKKFDQEYFRLHLGADYDNGGFSNRWDKACFVKDADSESYEILNHLWSRDKNYLYQGGYKLGLPDSSFTVLNECFAKDGQSVYTIGGIFANVKDPESFTVCDEGFDAETMPGLNPVKTLLPSDADWLEPESNNVRLLHGGYAKDKYSAYLFSELIDEYDESNDGIADEDKPQLFKRFTIINDIDTKSFESLAHGFACDIHKVYFLGQELEGCDPASFEIISLSPLEYSDLIQLPFSRDKNNVYLGYQKFPDADPDTFNSISSELRWFKDKQSIYYNQRQLHQADPQSFKLLDMNYGIDKSHAYFEHKMINDVDIQSFEQIGDQFVAQDNNYVYFEEKRGFKLTHGKLQGLPNFEGIDEYFKDNKNIYYSNFGELQIVDVDYDSFELIAKDYGDPEAKDINNHYLYGEIYNDTQDDIVLPTDELDDLQEVNNESIQDEIDFLNLLSYDKEIINKYVHYLTLEYQVESRIQQYSIDDYEKLGEILSGDDELEKYRVKKEIQEFKNYTEQVDNFLESEIDLLISDENDFIDELALHDLNEYEEIEKQSPEEAKTLQAIWWSDTIHSRTLREQLLACIEILADSEIKIIQDTKMLLCSPDNFHKHYKDEVDYIDIVTYAGICERVKQGEILDPANVVLDFMLLPNKILYSLNDIVFPSELKEIFTDICADRNITIDLSLLSDKTLTEHDFQDSGAYYIDLIAEKFEQTGNKLFCLSGRNIGPIELIGILPNEKYQQLIKYNSSELNFDDYFTEHPLRKGVLILDQSIATANQHNSDLLEKLDEYDKTLLIK